MHSPRAEDDESVECDCFYASFQRQDTISESGEVMTFKVLLVFDNATAHPADIWWGSADCNPPRLSPNTRFDSTLDQSQA